MLTFDNQFRRELPGDPETSNTTRQVNGAVWSPVMPTPVAAPRLIAYSQEMANELGLSAAIMQSTEGVNALGGNGVFAGSEPYATVYGGHQFGHWAGQLGDGRAIYLGEVVNAAGKRHELQLKGAGPTPYSRRADGRAVLRSSIREFLCSEAMFHLGIPTTRALSLVATGDKVVRDMFYDGNPEREPGAIVCRVAPSFTRFGHFEIHAARNDTALLKQLVEFTIARDFSELDLPLDPIERVGAWFGVIAQRTAVMVAHWMRVGFVHGVMNTDNMSILGLTIDYGPYGWIDNFDPGWTPNTTDAEGKRYCYGRQPEIARWNLERLGSALLTLTADESTEANRLVDLLQAGMA
ncbi:MAG: protein adenylyltransferase SelO, partial [Burkholderiales bacterium]